MVDIIFDDFKEMTENIVAHCREILQKTGDKYGDYDLISCDDDIFRLMFGWKSEESDERWLCRIVNVKQFIESIEFEKGEL